MKVAATCVFVEVLDLVVICNSADEVGLLPAKTWCVDVALYAVQLVPGSQRYIMCLLKFTPMTTGGIELFTRNLRFHLNEQVFTYLIMYKIYKNFFIWVYYSAMQNVQCRRLVEFFFQCARECCPCQPLIIKT